jgi:hypothetical protein
MPTVNPNGELPFDEIAAAFSKHTKERPLIFKINPTYQDEVGKEIEKVPAPSSKIFPQGELNIGDFDQGNLGDCFLISALNALLIHENGAKVLAGCIKDLSEYTHIFGNEVNNQVMVRVFSSYIEEDRTSPECNQLKQTVGYLMFDKAVFLTDKRAIGFPIAQLIEQALSYGNNLAGIFEDSRIYAYHQAVVYQALFGEDEDTVRSNTFYNNMNSVAFYQLADDTKQPILISELTRHYPGNEQPGELNYLMIENFVKAKAHFNDLIKQFWPKTSDAYSKRLSDFSNFVAAALKRCQDAPDPHFQIFINSLHDYGLGVLNNNYLSTEELNIIQRISNAFDNHHVVTMATKKELDNVSGQQQVTNEPLALGVVGSHAYAIVGAVHSKKIGEDDYYFLPVYNPWGASNPYGVSYTEPNSFSQLASDSSASKNNKGQLNKLWEIETVAIKLQEQKTVISNPTSKNLFSFFNALIKNYPSTKTQDRLLPTETDKSRFDLEFKHFVKVAKHYSISSTAINENTAGILSRQALETIASTGKSLNQCRPVNFDSQFELTSTKDIIQSRCQMLQTKPSDLVARLPAENLINEEEPKLHI